MADSPKFPISSSHLSEIMIMVTGLPTKDLQDHHEQLLRKEIHSCGVKHTVKYFKSLYSQGVAVACNLPVSPIPFRKSKRGIDKNLVRFLPYLKDSTQHKRAALTILRLPYLLKCAPELDMTSIIKPTRSVWRKAQYDDFSSFLLNAQRGHHGPHAKSVLKRFPRNKTREMKVRPRASAGPNGPSSLYSSGFDAIAIGKDANILKAISGLVIGLKMPSKFILDRKVLVKQQLSAEYFVRNDLCTGRLSLIAEGGCKTRVIAIGDLYSQTVLLPIHDECMERLGSLSNDGAMDQDRVKEMVRLSTLTKKPHFSYDLSSATDRFPIRLQKKVMQKLYNKNIAHHWANLMVKREFVTPTGEPVTYRTGQPMGLYSSWAVFSLSHHCLVLYAAACLGLDPTPDDYYILGDDIVIANSKIAELYSELIEELGVDISYEKSLISSKYPISAEFAKSIFHNGENISPIPPNLLYQVIKDVHLLPQLLEWASNSYGYSSPFPEGLSSLNLFRDRGLGVLLHSDYLNNPPVRDKIKINKPESAPSNRPMRGNPLTPDMNSKATKVVGPWKRYVDHPEVIAQVKERLRRVELLQKYNDLVADWFDPVLTGPGRSRKDQVTVPSAPPPPLSPFVLKTQEYLKTVLNMPHLRLPSFKRLGAHPLWWARTWMLDDALKVLSLRVTQETYNKFERPLDDLRVARICDPTGRAYQALPERSTKARSNIVIKALRALKRNRIPNIPGSSEPFISLQTFINNLNLPVVYKVLPDQSRS